MLLSLVAKALVLPRFGFEGVAVVTVASYGLLAVLVGRVRRKLADVPWRRRWPEFVGAAVLCVVGALLPPGWPGYTARAVVTVGLVGLLLLVIRQLNADRKSALAPVEPGAEAEPAADAKPAAEPEPADSQPAGSASKVGQKP